MYRYRVLVHTYVGTYRVYAVSSEKPLLENVKFLRRVGRRPVIDSRQFHHFRNPN